MTNRLFRFVRVRQSRKMWVTYRFRNRDIVPKLLSVLLSVFAGSAFAGPPVSPNAATLPTGGVVVGGSAVIGQSSGNALTVTQNSAKTAINWQSFSIGTGQSVTFAQPGASSVALNRVVGNDASAIYGSLKSNGQVYLLNTNGVYFSPSAVVDTGALVASTLAMSSADFMAGKMAFSAVPGMATGSVVNQGKINAAQGGYVILAGPRVSNEGHISAPGGTVGLAAGSRVLIDTVGDGLLKFSVDAGALGALASNSGTISADAGRVSLAANSLDGALSTVVNQAGIIRANTVGTKGGFITLSATGGDTVVTGTINATGAGAGQTGGTVQVLGDRVGLFGSAAIDASGAAGGGTVLVGGDLHGQGGVQTAGQTAVGSHASIKANALDAGNGGKVVVWADGSTSFNGSIEARGGATGGDGGFVETSGKNGLSIASGKVDASAAAGRPGTWLLDPTDIVVANGGGATIGDVDTFAVNAGTTQTIDPGVLDAALANVVLQATNDITFTDAVTLTTPGASLKAQAGHDIIVNAGITTSNGNLNLWADNAVSLNAPVSLGGGSLRVASSTGAGDAGSFTSVLNGSIDTGGGSLNIATSGATSLVGAIAANGLTVTATGQNITLTNAANAVTGTANLTGAATQLTNTKDTTAVLATSGATTLTAMGKALNVSGTTTGALTTSAAATTLGTLSVGSANLTASGAVTQTGVLTDAGALTVSAAGQNITLTNAANAVTGTA
ncbi:MAG: filamentous hemagglutinin N-terminal domain-containing protein, partial [Betaproteobacteria bacterium]